MKKRLICLLTIVTIVMGLYVPAHAAENKSLTLISGAAATNGVLGNITIYNQYLSTTITSVDSGTTYSWLPNAKSDESLEANDIVSGKSDGHSVNLNNGNILWCPGGWGYEHSLTNPELTYTVRFDLKRAYDITRVDVHERGITETTGISDITISVGLNISSMTEVTTTSSTVLGDSAVNANHANGRGNIETLESAARGRYVDITMSISGSARLTQIMIFGEELETLNLISGKVASNGGLYGNADVYPKYLDANLVSVSDAATYTWAEESGITDTTKVNDAYTVMVPSSWGDSCFWLTGKNVDYVLTFDLKEDFEVTRVDLHETQFSPTYNHFDSVTLKAGTSLDNLSDAAINTEYSSVLEFNGTDDLKVHKMTLEKPVEARYIQVTINVGADSMLNEICIFGNKIERRDLNVISGNALTEADIEWYKTEQGINLTSLDTDVSYFWMRDEMNNNKDADVARLDDDYNTDGIRGEKNIIDGNLTSDKAENIVPGTKVTAVIFDFGKPYNINRVDLHEIANSANSIAGVKVSAGDKLGALAAKKTVTFGYSAETELTHRVNSADLTDVNARYLAVEIILDDGNSETTNLASYNLGDVVVFGDEIPYEETPVAVTLDDLRVSVEEALGYDNYIPYDDADWEVLQDAIDDADALLGNETAEEAQIIAVKDALDSAIYNLDLRGGQQILSPNTFIHADFNAFYERYPRLTEAKLPNVTARFMNTDDGYEVDTNIAYTKNENEETISRDTTELFDGGHTLYSGNEGIWSAWQGNQRTTYVLFDFGEECWINGADVRTSDYRQYNGSGKYIGELAVSVSDDGVNFTPVAVAYPEEISAPEDIGRHYSRVTSVTFPAVKARYARVDVIPASGTNQYVLMEMWVRGKADDTNKVVLTKNAANDMVTADVVIDGNEESAALALAIYDRDGMLSNVVTSVEASIRDGKAVLRTEAPITTGQTAKGMAFDTFTTIKPIAKYDETSNFTETEFTLTNLLADGAVVQRGKKLAIFGTATTGTKIDVRMNDSEFTTTADACGKWLVYGDIVEEGNFYDVEATAGNTTYSAYNLIAGDVWLCSGQSNMFYSFNLLGNEELPTDTYRNYTDLYYYHVPTGDMTQLEPQNTVGGEWKNVSELTEAELSNLSALATFSGMELSDYTGVPIGIIEASVGGTHIEQWISREAIMAAENIGNWEISRNTTLFNTMINPLIPYGIKGVLWYQGCQNVANRADNAYLNLQLAWLNDWRTRWGDNDLPFIITQLSTYSDNRFTYIRDQQLALRDNAENVGIVSIMDLGDVTGTVGDDIHPREKKAVAERLVRAARAIAYGDTEVEYLFPVVKSATLLSDGSVDVVFDGVYDGLEIKAGDSTVTAFKLEINGTAYDATATITSADTVNVKVDGIVKPDAVAFAYEGAPDPEVNLFNSAGLAASPFRVELN